MGRVNHYMKDRALLLRPITVFNKGVVAQSSAPQAIGTWIPCRLRDKSGAETPEEARVELPESFELVLNIYDENGNRVQVEQADTFEIRTKFDGALDYEVTNYKIDGAIVEIRKVSKLVSYVIPIVRDTEF